LLRSHQRCSLRAPIPAPRNSHAQHPWQHSAAIRGHKATYGNPHEP
jgi:hypothetical protein